jgi:DNA-binding PadR family transcriptional regulator
MTDRDPLFEIEIQPVVKGSRGAAHSLYQQLKTAILDGRLKAGTQLPPSRLSGDLFGVSRNTITEVYERLILHLIILLLLNERPRYGYEVIKALEEQSSGIYTPSPGMVYPALTYLDEVGFATASSEGSKKLYTLTAEGKAHLSENGESAGEVWQHLARVGRKLADFQRQIAEDEDVADHFARDPRDRNRREWREMKAQFREVRDDLKAALYGKLDSSLQEKTRILGILRRAVNDIRGKS